MPFEGHLEFFVALEISKLNIYSTISRKIRTDVLRNAAQEALLYTVGMITQQNN